MKMVLGVFVYVVHLKLHKHFEWYWNKHRQDVQCKRALNLAGVKVERSFLRVRGLQRVRWVWVRGTDSMDMEGNVDNEDIVSVIRCVRGGHGRPDFHLCRGFILVLFWALHLVLVIRGLLCHPLESQRETPPFQGPCRWPQDASLPCYSFPSSGLALPAVHLIGLVTDCQKGALIPSQGQMWKKGLDCRAMNLYSLVAILIIVVKDGNCLLESLGDLKFQGENSLSKVGLLRGGQQLERVRGLEDLMRVLLYKLHWLLERTMIQWLESSQNVPHRWC